MSLETVVSRWWPVVDPIAVRYGISQALVLAVITQESGGDPTASRFEPSVSSWATVQAMAKGDAARLHYLASSWGLMQVMGYHRPSLDPGQLCDPATNIEAGCEILKNNYVEHGSWEDAIAAYNGGDGAVSAKRAGRYPNDSYVRNVLALWEEAMPLTRALLAQETASRG
jgi:soluble lytic murein transglycosylase-like protein